MSWKFDKTFQHFLDDDRDRIPRALTEWRQNIHTHLARAPSEPRPLPLETLANIINAKPGKHLSHSNWWNYDDRLATLTDAGFLTGVSKDVLKDIAKAGFFYSDPILSCAHCGNTINDWTRGDNPWIRHAEMKPKCAFLKRYCKVNSAGEITEFRKRHSSVESY